jgi:protoporphyrinogen oxidase
MAAERLTILGGGLAGLSAGYYARKNGTPFTIFEASDRPGGNCLTLTHGPFRFDSGAHRLHDKDPETTAEMKRLLGDALAPIVRPFKYCSGGRFLDYPPSLRNALRGFGPAASVRAVLDAATARIRPTRPWRSYEDFAMGTYGKTLAERFILGYTEKLWGVSCDRLAPEVATRRFRGFGPKALAARLLRGRRAHPDGVYHYPQDGIGEIAAALAASFEPGALRPGSSVVRLEHDGERIRKIGIEGGHVFDAGDVVSTIPLDRLIRALAPSPPAGILEAAGRLRFRNVVLAAFFLDRPSVTDAATIYFADRGLSIIRAYEPRNRSPRMAPPGKTSLVAEIPCDPGDATWTLPDAAVIAGAREELERTGLLIPAEILGTGVHRMPWAYPVPEKRLLEDASELARFAGRFGNLRLSGRCGTYRYLWMHEVMAQGRSLFERRS